MPPINPFKHVEYSDRRFYGGYSNGWNEISENNNRKQLEMWHEIDFYWVNVDIHYLS